MLGPFEVRTDDGGLADVPGARLRGLLVALALRPGQVVPKASLVDWIWGEQTPADATNALQRLVSRLRKVLPDGVIEGHTDGYLLKVEPDGVDAVRFERLVAASQVRSDDSSRRARLLREAVELWRGAPLQDVGLQESAAFDAVVVRLEGLRLAAVEERADAEITLGRGAEMVTELSDLVAAHPLRERLVAALMRALVAGGRDSEALQVYQRAREGLAGALGVDPSPELAALHVSLLRGELGRREETRKTNLRAELTAFVGKDADVAAVCELLSEHRLTTVIGPGGAGKTRLATETARTMLDDLPDGAWLVELAAIGADGDVADVAQATLGGLGLRDALLGGAQNADLTERLIAAIREREMLVVLDNCEHVIEAVAVFAHRLLGECRRLRILATSREPLGITGEALWPVKPLALPEEDADPGEIEASPAVRLLRDRAGAVRRDLGGDAAALATMVRVCRALDGMPLAIELAAARLRTMSLDQLANGLDDRFRLLTGGSRTALPHHKTLRAAVDWSWELLSAAERTVLRRLSVFSGGASLKAAERVCAEGTDDVLELLTALTEKSLLVAEGDGVPRYRMIGTIKEYAAQRLAEAGESETTRRAHRDYFTELAETAEPLLRRSQQLTWLAVLEAEHDNIGAAMRGALAAGEAQAAMRLAVGAGWYWWLAGHKTEGLELIIAASKTPGEVTDEVRAVVYALISMFVTAGPGDEHTAEVWIREAHRYKERGPDNPHSHPALRLISPVVHMLRDPNAVLHAWEPLLDDEDPWVRALARLHQGKMRIVLGHGGRDADEYLEQALTRFRALGERFGIQFALAELADRIAMRGEFAAACDLYEQAVVAAAPFGATEDLIRMRSQQAQLYWLLGDPDAGAAVMAEAEQYAERVTWPGALAMLALNKAGLARWSGDADEAHAQLAVATALLGEEAERAHIRAFTRNLLGYLADDLEEARAHCAAACEAAAEATYAMAIAPVLVGVANLALRDDEPEQAARLLGASEDVLGLADRTNPDLARIERAARSRLGDARFAEAAQEGADADWTRLVEVTLAS
ncbi:winged helix-turn-helix domain-containing protein [Actinomadura barringtoniae]|uniref:Winged helix-turn-helix domain-containing protein n=2 Tax=Actinomadura barringtoniae TaxID=1427535 RepID=A0A939PDG1_9ACTN|nr:winged helix-turn-helix domain-containing protein [Actinomadura barringtoniae]